MDTHSLETLKAFREFLDEESGLPPEARRAVLDRLLEHLAPPDDGEHEDIWESGEEPGSYRGINRDLFRKGQYYAIHGYDLHLAVLKEAVTVISALYAALQNPIAVVGGLVIIFYQYRRKRIRLNAEQALVLEALQRAPEEGWTAGRLWHELPPNDFVDPQRLHEILAGLREVRTANGQATMLAAEKDGRWWAVDV